MSKKRTSLDAIMTKAVEDVAPPPARPAPTVREAPPDAKKPSVYLTAPVHEQLRTLAFQERKKMHDYLLEGLDLVFRQKGLPSIAELNAKGEA
jgi:hypothetical protein